MTDIIVPNWGRVPTGILRKIYSQALGSETFTGRICFHLTVNSHEITAWNVVVRYANLTGYSDYSATWNSGYNCVDFENWLTTTPLILKITKTVSTYTIFPAPILSLDSNGGWYEVTLVGVVGTNIAYKMLGYGSSSDWESAGFTINNGPYSMGAGSPVFLFSDLSLEEQEDGSYYTDINVLVNGYLKCVKSDNNDGDGTFYDSGCFLMSSKPGTAPHLWYSSNGHQYAVKYGPPVAPTIVGTGAMVSGLWTVTITNPESNTATANMTYLPYTMNDGDY